MENKKSDIEKVTMKSGFLIFSETDRKSSKIKDLNDFD